MTVARVISGILRRPATLRATSIPATDFNHLPSQTTNPFFSNPVRSFAFSSAEEASAERRLRKRRLRQQPPSHAVNRDLDTPRPKRNPNQPETTSNLIGPRLGLHSRIQNLIRAGDIDNAAVVARQSLFSKTRPTLFTCNSVINSMYREKRYLDAIALFTYFFKQSNIVPNIASYNILIVCYCDNGQVDKALEVYEHILDTAPFTPSVFTFRHLTKGLVDAGRINEAVDLLWKMVGDGFGADPHVFNNIISGFLKLGNLERANEFFDELKGRCLYYDGIVNATFMEWFFSQGKTKEAIEYYKSYKSLLDKEFKMVPATCNVILSVLLKWGRKREAEALFDSMLDRHTPPVVLTVNSDTFNLMVNECFKNGKGSEAYSVFKKVGKALKSKPVAMDTAGYSNIIMRYCETDMLDDAEKLYVEFLTKYLRHDVDIYKPLIDAYFKSGRIYEAMEKFMKMVDVGLRVMPSSANKWFSNLIENGKIVECEPILTQMAEKDLKPDATTYDIVIRAFCGVSNYDSALCLLQQMIRCGVGVSPALKEYLLEVFEKAGRKEEIEQCSQYSNTRYNGYAYGQQQYNNGSGNYNGNWLQNTSQQVKLESTTGLK